MTVLLVFGDYAYDVHASLKQSCRSNDRGGSMVQRFLDRVCAAIQYEISRLPASQRHSIPSFTSIQELNEQYSLQQFKSVAIDSALLVVAQLIQYINYIEQSDIEDLLGPGEEICTVGIGSGIFAATVASIPASGSGLIEVAVRIVSLAFHAGLRINTVSELLRQPYERSESWVYNIPGRSESEVKTILEDFYRETNIPLPHQAYISSVSWSSVQISGVPSTLKEVLDRHSLRSVAAPLPIYGPYHARNIHSTTDLGDLLQWDKAEVLSILGRSKIRRQIISGTPSELYPEQKPEELLDTVLQSLFREQVSRQVLLNRCLAKAPSQKWSKYDIVALGPGEFGSELESAIKDNSKHEVILHQVQKRDILPPQAQESTPSRGRLAIVGMAGRFPGAANHDKLWDLLQKGLDVHREAPPDRFDVRTHVDPTGKTPNTSHTPYGCWIDDPGLFDPRFFNMSPREALQTDPMQRLAIVTAYEALEMSGYVPNRTPSTRLDRIGTFYGQTSDDWREINAAQDIDTYFITGGVRAFGPGRINYHFGFSGPSYIIDTACSSSMAAMVLACTSLWAKDCDTAIVGGLNCMTNPDIFAGLSRGQFLSKNGPCSTFDNDADGYCRGDGVGTVIVKRLEDAEADKDNILGIILGVATNHSADAISITHPHGETQETLYKRILSMSGVDANGIDYVEMHGTGTQAGDGTEMKSVTNVFAPADYKRNTPLYLGSVKANVGHGEAASGITALIKCILMMRESIIPPHCGIKKQINTAFPPDLDQRKALIAFRPTEFPRKDRPRRIFINNFSAAGGNSGLILEDAPQTGGNTIDPRKMHVVTISGKSKSSLLRNIERLVYHIRQHSDIQLADLAYSTTARRIHHNWRVGISISNISQIYDELEQKSSGDLRPIPSDPPGLVWLFTGQGSHYAAMGQQLFKSSSVFRDSMLEYSAIAAIHGFPSPLPLIDGSTTDIESLSPVVVQTGLVCFEMAMSRFWMSLGLKPNAVLGHSLGEYAALHIAGVLSASDNIYLVGMRAQLLVDNCVAGTHSMLAVKESISRMMEVLGDVTKGLTVSCVNGPRDTVVSGEAARISEASDILLKAGVKSTIINVPFAFHSPQVEPIINSFSKVAATVKYNKSSIPFISTMFGKPLGNSASIDATYLAYHMRKKVDFLNAVISMRESGLVDSETAWLELGPHPVCTGLVKSCLGTPIVSAASSRKGDETYNVISQSLCTLHCAGFNLNWNEYYRDFSDCVKLLTLPSYAFDEKVYWIQYEGDWCLTKNRISGRALEPKEVKSTISTSTIHRVISKKFDGDIALITTESDLSHPELRKAIIGHRVNDTGLCPSSIYADMAMTVCSYIYRRLRPDDRDIGFDVANMTVKQPLIARPDAKDQILRLIVEADLKQGRANLRYATGGIKETVHAEACVLFGNKSEWLAQWHRDVYLIQGRIDYLKEAEKHGRASKISRGLAYKLFAALVDYSPSYRGMEEVILQAENMEATSRVVFQTKSDGVFMCSPYWIDSVAHISGFIVNGSDAVDSRNQVYISHGWESLRIAEPLELTKTYRSYVRMQPSVKNVLVGNVYVFTGDKIVAVVQGLKFQCIPRTVLNTLLPPGGLQAIATPPKQEARQYSSVNDTPPSRKPLPDSAASSPKSKSIWLQVLDIIATEIGVGQEELADNIDLNQLGVDSLMSLAISGSIRENLDINIPSNVFSENSTIGKLKEYFSHFSASSTPRSATSRSEDETQFSSDMIETPGCSSPTGITTPSVDENSEFSNILRTTIAAEMGIELEELLRVQDLSSLGMDSLMALSILGSLREQTGMELPGDAFLVNASLKELEESLNPSSTVQNEIPIQEVPRIAPAKLSTQPTLTPEWHATSVLLQGHPKTCKKQVWVVPDGSGSATSYVHIPPLSPDIAMWGLNSPFMKNADEYTCGVVGIASYFIKEIKRRQPQGPYILAGWSAGGVISFETVNQLIKSGDSVDNLILIDTPCPLIIEPLPRSLHRWFGSIGLLGDGGGDLSSIPSWVLPHFAASVTALSNYTAEVIDPEKCPLTTIIWCEDGVCKYPTDPKPDPYPYGHAQFLLENRTDFGPYLWDTYLNIDKITCRQMPGNHFSMMRGEYVSKLCGARLIFKN
ncbi:hypothetical protein F5884DRAFT_670201 [Xylogone sp. PMI_703]|nr:hypothetical protein F5884DRAFT_670201 [Xylogone sp. PMI_703]